MCSYALYNIVDQIIMTMHRYLRNESSIEDIMCHFNFHITSYDVAKLSRKFCLGIHKDLGHQWLGYILGKHQTLGL